jgi:hypothetical protein
MRVANDNSPAILTAIGAVGVVATAYLTARATAKSVEVIRVEETDRRELLEPKEKVEMVWKNYIPPIISGVTTIALIVAANRIGNRRIAGVAAVAAISERAYEEYRNKTIEKHGETRDRAIRDEIAQDRVNRTGGRELVVIGDGEVIFLDSFTKRYFKSTMQTVQQAVNDINGQILEDFSASLSDFYDLIGLSRTSYSDLVGWNLDRKLKVNYSTAITPLSEGQKPCMVIDFDKFPAKDYDNIN